MTGSSWNFELLGLSTLSFQQFVNYSSGVSTPALVARDGFCSGKLWCFVSDCLQFFSQQFAFVTSLLWWSKESCWFFSFFSFLLVRIEWQLLNSVHTRQETRNSCWNCFSEMHIWQGLRRRIQGYINRLVPDC